MKHRSQNVAAEAQQRSNAMPSMAHSTLAHPCASQMSLFQRSLKIQKIPSPGQGRDFITRGTTLLARASHSFGYRHILAHDNGGNRPSLIGIPFSLLLQSVFQKILILRRTKPQFSAMIPFLLLFFIAFT